MCASTNMLVNGVAGRLGAEADDNCVDNPLVKAPNINGSMITGSSFTPKDAHTDKAKRNDDSPTIPITQLGNFPNKTFPRHWDTHNIPRLRFFSLSLYPVHALHLRSVVWSLIDAFV